MQVNYTITIIIIVESKGDILMTTSKQIGKENTFIQFMHILLNVFNLQWTNKACYWNPLIVYVRCVCVCGE